MLRQRQPQILRLIQPRGGGAETEWDHGGVFEGDVVGDPRGELSRHARVHLEGLVGVVPRFDADAVGEDAITGGEVGYGGADAVDGAGSVAAEEGGPGLDEKSAGGLLPIDGIDGDGAIGDDKGVGVWGRHFGGADGEGGSGGGEPGG